MPKDFTWDELVSLLSQNGFRVINGSGSRYKFVNSDERVLSFHKPHPENVLKMYILKQVKNLFDEIGI